MLEYQVRVIEERKELSEKIDKLLTFIVSEHSPQVSDTALRLLKRQYLAMDNYLDILNERIAAFEE
jgi:uncharacterized protein